jgi:ABC-type sugar transport system substrate-binding protein
MRVTKARFGSLALYLLAWPLLTSCERAPESAPPKHYALRDLLIVAIGPSEDDPQWPGVRGGVERFFADIPSLHGRCVAAPEPTPAALRSTVERALEWNPNVICLLVADVEAARPCIDLIARRQCMLVTLGKATGDSRVAAHVGIDATTAAEQLADNLSRIAAGRQTYVLVHEAGRSEAAKDCYLRFSDAVQHRYDLTLLKEADDTERGQTPARAVEQLLGLFPHAGLIVTLNPEVWLEASPAWLGHLHQLNANFRFATLSAAPRLWPRLGTPASPGDAAALLGPLDGDMGYQAAKLAVQLMISTERRSTSITIPCELVTAENLPDFERRYAKAAGGPVDAFLPTTRP